MFFVLINKSVSATIHSAEKSMKMANMAKKGIIDKLSTYISEKKIKEELTQRRPAQETRGTAQLTT
jgi:hypothetical protein